MKNMKRSIALVVAIALLIGCVAGGTMAWLTMQTDSVVNTFTVGDINITLTETDYDSDSNNNENNFKFVPGNAIAKDPNVTVDSNSEDCYLFIKVTEQNNTQLASDPIDKVINWNVRGDWTPVPDHAGYWYIENPTKGTPIYILAGGTNGQVNVSEKVTKEMVTALTSNKPTLTFTAAAIQKANTGSVVEAFTKLPPAFTGITP